MNMRRSRDTKSVPWLSIVLAEHRHDSCMITLSLTSELANS